MAEKEEQPNEPRELQGEEKGAKPPGALLHSFTKHPLQLPLSHLYQQLPFLNMGVISALVHFQGMKSAGNSWRDCSERDNTAQAAPRQPVLGAAHSHTHLMGSDCETQPPPLGRGLEQTVGGL